MIVPCFAQRDIKDFNKIGTERIIKILGTPEPVDEVLQLVFPDLVFLHYKSCAMEINKDGYELNRFNTESPDFCVLSDYISGGFKVRDPVSKLKSFDFAKSKYGRNNPGNALTRLNEAKEYYVAYQEEYYHLYFEIKDGFIYGIMLKASEDLPYEGYNNPYSPW